MSRTKIRINMLPNQANNLAKPAPPPKNVFVLHLPSQSEFICFTHSLTDDDDEDVDDVDDDYRRTHPNPMLSLSLGFGQVSIKTAMSWQCRQVADLLL